MINLEENLKKVKESTKYLNVMSSKDKNRILNEVAKSIEAFSEEIINANKVDIEKARMAGMKDSLIDRLKIDDNRIKGMAAGLRDVAALADPVGETIEGKKLENGLEILKRRVPLGVIAIIYESRPNVTVDAFGLCFKTGNATVLKGGSDAINTNITIIKIIKETLKKLNISENIIYLLEDTSRETAQKLMKMNSYIDVLIPRGGRGLIKTVVENSTIPVIETGTGNCHIYVDETADLEMAKSIIINAKTQRTGVCNACESLLVNENIAEVFIPSLVRALNEKNVEVRGDALSRKISDKIVAATAEDWETEYLDLIISLKVVKDIEEAINHINHYSTKHSESIITKDYQNAQKFLNEVDSSCVYVNASTRFTDGGEFGLGAEIGISTQKLHARGPMGLKELTTTKYVIYGNGQIRE